MKLKKGVSLIGAKPELLIGLMVAQSVYEDFGKELVITSGTEGKHSKNSKHYLGLAADLRTNYFVNGEADKVVLDLRTNLNEEFFVQNESNHIHLQFNGKQQ